MYIYYVYINTHVYSKYFENIYMCIFIFLYFILYKNIFNKHNIFFINIYMHVFVFMHLYIIHIHSTHACIM